GIDRWQSYGIQAAGCLLLKSRAGSLGRTTGYQGGCACGVQDSGGREIVGIGVPGALAGDDANAASGGDTLRSRFDHRLIHGQAGRGKIFKVKVCVIAARRKGSRQVTLEIAVSQAIVLKKEVLIAHDYWMTSGLERLRPLYRSLSMFIRHRQPAPAYGRLRR